MTGARGPRLDETDLELKMAAGGHFKLVVLRQVYSILKTHSTGPDFQTFYHMAMRGESKWWTALRPIDMGDEVKPFRVVDGVFTVYYGDGTASAKRLAYAHLIAYLRHHKRTQQMTDLDRAKIEIKRRFAHSGTDGDYIRTLENALAEMIVKYEPVKEPIRRLLEAYYGSGSLGEDWRRNSLYELIDSLGLKVVDAE